MSSGHNDSNNINLLDNNLETTLNTVGSSSAFGTSMQTLQDSDVFDDEMDEILASYKQEFDLEASALKELEEGSPTSDNENVNGPNNLDYSLDEVPVDDGEPKFVCDTTIPGVAKHLRMLGIDTLHHDNFSQNYILYLARTQHRTILTFSMKLQKNIDQILNNYKKKKERVEELKKKLNELQVEDETKPQISNSSATTSTPYNKWKETKEKIQTRIEQYEMDLSDPILSYPYKYYLLKTKGRYNQINEVVNTFKIRYIPEKMFTRCASCSGTLRKIPNKEEVKHLLEQNTYNDNDHYSMCNRCKQLFWGIHIENPAQREAVEKAIAFCEEYSYKGD